MDLPHQGFALLALVFVLGAKHGLDADHLATIDGLTRYNLQRSPSRARWCGALFSLGHGGVVVALAVGVGLAATEWAVPAWMEHVGNGVSIAFLTLLGGLNLHAVWRTTPEAVVTPVGLKAGALRHLQATSHPLAIVGVGALFALSFDTLSQAALWAVTATRQGGPVQALTLGLVFLGGMLVVDGFNGLCLARLLRHADRRARLASRVMGLTVAVISLSVAALGAARWVWPDLAGALDGHELTVGLAVCGAVCLGFAVAWVSTRASAQVEGATPAR